MYTLFLLVSDLFSKVCRDQVCCRSDSKKIPISSSGSAAVTERKLLRTVLFFGPHSICFLGLVLGDIMPIFVRNFIFQQFSIIQLVRFSLCGNPGVFPCFLLSVLSWRVCSLVFFFFLVLSSPLCFLVLSIFDTETRLCKARCPHPGEVVYLTYLIFLWFFMFILKKSTCYSETRLCKARCPHPGEVVYLTYLSLLWFLMIVLSILRFRCFLLSCLFPYQCCDGPFPFSSSRAAFASPSAVWLNSL